MCGISGYSLSPTSTLDPLLLARVLLAAVAERGADAAGCTWEHEGRIHVHKQPGGASTFLDELAALPAPRQLVLHVRDHTKGRPSLPANNHPIRHGRIVGVHNGRITNDDEIFTTLKRERAEAGMTVDSEAIFAALDAHGLTDTSAALEMLRGPMVAAWFDAYAPGRVFIARGYGRPLWLAATSARADGRRDIIWASTLEAIEIVEEFVGVRLFRRPVHPGRLLTFSAGRLVRQQRFRADESAQWLVNPIASPEERATCLQRLATG